MVLRRVHRRDAGAWGGAGAGLTGAEGHVALADKTLWSRSLGWGPGALSRFRRDTLHAGSHTENAWLAQTEAAGGFADAPSVQVLDG